MNLPRRWVTFLEEAGFPAQHWSLVGACDAPDSEIMAYARAEGFTVLTNDLDFSALLMKTGRVQPSVIQIRADDLRIEAIGTLVVLCLRRMLELNESGVLVTVGSERTRFRLLPFGQRKDVDE